MKKKKKKKKKKKLRLKPIARLCNMDLSRLMLVKPPDLIVIKRILTALSLRADMRSFCSLIGSQQMEHILILAAAI